MGIHAYWVLLPITENCEMTVLPSYPYQVDHPLIVDVDDILIQVPCKPRSSPWRLRTGPTCLLSTDYPPGVLQFCINFTFPRPYTPTTTNHHFETSQEWGLLGIQQTRISIKLMYTFACYASLLEIMYSATQTHVQYKPCSPKLTTKKTKSPKGKKR